MRSRAYPCAAHATRAGGGARGPARARLGGAATHKGWYVYRLGCARGGRAAPTLPGRRGKERVDGCDRVALVKVKGLLCGSPLESELHEVA